MIHTFHKNNHASRGSCKIMMWSRWHSTHLCTIQLTFCIFLLNECDFCWLPATMPVCQSLSRMAQMTSLAFGTARGFGSSWTRITCGGREPKLCCVAQRGWDLEVSPRTCSIFSIPYVPCMVYYTYLNLSDFRANVGKCSIYGAYGYCLFGISMLVLWSLDYSLDGFSLQRTCYNQFCWTFR